MTTAPRFTTVNMSDLAKRSSWSPGDFLYAPGQRVTINGALHVVAWQRGRDVGVAVVENVPGSSTPFACSLPRAVTVFDIDIRVWNRRRGGP